MPSGFVSAGNWIIDHVKLIHAWPSEETLSNILSEFKGTGGAPYNVLLGLRAFDSSIPLTGVGVIGDDADGDFIENDLRTRNIDFHLRRSANLPTSYTDVMTVQSTGRRTFFHNRGGNAEFVPDDIPWDNLEARYFHFGYLLLLDAMDAEDPEYGTPAARVLATARAKGMITSVDVVSESGDRFARISRPALPHTDLLICNEIEAGRIAGIELRPGGAYARERLHEAAETLLGMGVNVGVVIHAVEGGYALMKSGEEAYQPSLKLPPGYIAGGAGAGDAFCTGFLYGTHEDWPLQRRLLLAVCAAAANLSDPTCTGGIRGLDETLELGIMYRPEG